MQTAGTPPPLTATTHVSIALARLAALTFLLLFVVFKYTSVRCFFHAQYVFKLPLSSIVLCFWDFFFQLLEVVHSPWRICYL